ncbi:DUF1772 domain-containing protein [Rickettsia endosymbiont of Oedothorax gibbosus]|uniref:DUF1772 domain-containing protein n=1 Tax=Rickettsia endosymbiont of Oedothorax gibbosus TaxID=931099 RepID=UPI002023C231|nr:DUF1772 domain-containing protein [Rickettsia endosymbiont of Oedothorax gibbosus]
MPKIIELIALITISIFAGGCIVIGLVLVPFWQSMNPADFLSYFSSWSFTIGATMLTIGLIAQCSVILALMQNKSGKRRNLWCTSAVSLGMTFVLFFVYFVKANAGFAHSTIDPLQVVYELKLWELMHWLRVGLILLSTLLAIIALVDESE